MADIRKTFNFRDGVQVDDEVLVVRGSRVGLGTTSPDQLLDVRGNANITGVTSTVDFNATGVGTFGSVSLGSTIVMDSTSGVVTAVAFKGDGSTLSNLPTSQWLNVNVVGAGASPIYVEGNVGIGTTDPANPLQIGGNPNNGIGVGFSTSGNIKASGIITATTFSGTFIGNVTGNLTGNADTATFAPTAGVATVAQNLTGSPDVTVSNINVTGVGTYASLEATSFTTPILTGHNSIRSTHGSSTTIAVTVAAKTAAHRYNGIGSTNGFKLDGVEAPFLTLTPGRTYIFDVSDGSNTNEEFRFYYDVDKTTQYTTNVTASGNAGTTGSTVTLVVTDTTPTVLHYQSVSSVKMGNAVQTNSNILDTEHNSTVRGTLTATTVIGNLTGTATTANNLSNAANITTGTINLARLPDPIVKNLTGNVTGNVNSSGLSTFADLNITGVSTFNSNIDSNAEAEFANINVGLGTITTATNTTLFVSGVSTFQGAVDIDNNVSIQNNLNITGDLDVDGHTQLDNVNISGIVTAPNIEGTVTGSLIGNATGLTGTPHIVVNNLQVSGVSTVQNITANRIGIGTITPNTNLHIFDASTTASLYVGKDDDTSVDGGVFKYGGGSQQYSQTNSLDILNYGLGNLNSFIHGNDASFMWHKGNNLPLMSLTDDGNLGIGNTSPDQSLMVVGNAHFQGPGIVTAHRFIADSNFQGRLDGTHVGLLTGTVNDVGISTFNMILISGDDEGIGIGTTSQGNAITIGFNDVPRDFFMIGSGTTNPTRPHSSLGCVGIGTNRFSPLGSGGSVPSLEVRGPSFVHGGFFKAGGKQPDSSATDFNARSLVDFSESSDTHDGVQSLAAAAYMIVPRVTTAQRNNFRDGRTGSTTLLTGSMVYDTDLNKLCVYDNGGWKGVTLGTL